MYVLCEGKNECPGESICFVALACMTRILGHLPGLLERFEASVVTFLDLPQQNSRAVRGIKPN